MVEPRRATPTRRRLLASLAATGLLGGGAGCAIPWATGPAPPAARPAAVRPAGQRLRLVVSGEGYPAFDRALRDVVGEGARRAGMTVEVQDVGTFVRPDRGAPEGPAGSHPAPVAATIANRLLEAVQAGTPPDAVLLLGREAQVARFQAQGLVQDVSGLMRRAVRRLGGVPRVAETLHVVAGNWFAVPWYQRLVGHWVRQSVLQAAGLDPGRDLSYVALREALRPEGASTGDPPWGIGAADTPDVDAWCWGAIHAWGGGLADRKGEHVALDTPGTVEALAWLASTVGAPGGQGYVPPAAGRWSDEAKNAAFEQGRTAYTYSERAFVAVASGPGGPGGPGDAVYLRTLAGPAARPRAVGGGGAWLMPRGAPSAPVELFLEAMLEPALQRRLWGAGGPFVLPAYLAGWDDPVVTGAAWAVPARRYRDELDPDGDAFVSATGNGGPETAASQAVGGLRFGAGMLRDVVAGRPAAEVAAQAQRRAADLYRSFGLPG